MIDKLKSCPFCGGEAELKYTSWWDSCDPPEKHDVWSVGCAKRPTHEDCCLGRLCMSRGYKDRDKAIAAWNSRAERTCRDVNGNPHDFTCSECCASMYTQVDECWTMVARGGRCDDVIESPSYCPNCGAKVVEQ